MTEWTDEDLARVVHAAHIALNAVLSPHRADQPFMLDALSPAERAFVVARVRLIRSGATHEQVQQHWVDWMAEDGWVLGPEKDWVLKTHPDMVPYDQLSYDGQSKVRQAFRIVFTHVVPDDLMGTWLPLRAAERDMEERAAREITMMAMEWDLPEAMVCVTHMRFAPCRKEGEHLFSEDPDDIEAVRKFHQE